MNLDYDLEAIADEVEDLIRRELKPSNVYYHRTYLSQLADILKKRAKRPLTSPKSVV